MKRILMFVFVLLVASQCGWAQSVIPFVDVSSEVWVINGDISQNVTLDFREALSIHVANTTRLASGTPRVERETLFLRSWQTLQVNSSIRGFVRVTSTYPVHAWSVVQGASFPAVSINTTGVSARVFFIADGGAITVVNPHDVPVRATFWLYTGGLPELHRNWEFGPGTAMVGFFKDLIASPTCTEIAGLSCAGRKGYTVILTSERPLGVGVARCRTAVCESVPIATIR